MEFEPCQSDEGNEQTGLNCTRSYLNEFLQTAVPWVIEASPLPSYASPFSHVIPPAITALCYYARSFSPYFYGSFTAFLVHLLSPRARRDVVSRRCARRAKLKVTVAIPCDCECVFDAVFMRARCHRVRLRRHSLSAQRRKQLIFECAFR